MLQREELVEQAYFFRVLRERLDQNMPMQDLLASVREEILATTKLPMAIDFLLAELRHHGVMATAMQRLPHYFTAFQTYLMDQAENPRGRFDFRIALEILRQEAEFRGGGGGVQGVFLYQFETLCRNRLQYDQGLQAIGADPIYDDPWRDWIQTVRRQIGIIDFCDLVYVRSEYYLIDRRRRGETDAESEKPILFGDREGKIALANRHKDPLLFFAAIQRQLGYPTVPRPKPVDESPTLIPQLLRRMERLESRIKLLEEEQRQGIDITRFYQGPTPPPPADDK